MKVCPTCQKTYTDDNLNFCLDDGTVLTQQASAQDSMPATVFMNQPRPTNPQASFGSPPATQSSWNAPPPPYSPPPKKSSKTWIWVLGILGLVVVLCGGGTIGLFIIGSLVPAANKDSNGNTQGNHVVFANTKASPGPSVTGSPKTNGTPDDSNAETIDLSTWVKENSSYGITSFTNGEFFMASKEKSFYYVLVSPDDYSTDGVTTKVTLRNVDDANSSMGYGLIFHSDPTPLTKDYAFLIDAKKKKYRVVRHEPQKEISVVAWTNSPLIKDGTQENILEAHDKGDSTELYINGQMVTSIKN
ncbi:MAG: hypothetical protein ACRD43_14835, partial [Pyrinomonadaceae bacterium]